MISKQLKTHVKQVVQSNSLEIKKEVQGLEQKIEFVQSSSQEIKKEVHGLEQKIESVQST